MTSSIPKRIVRETRRAASYKFPFVAKHFKVIRLLCSPAIPPSTFFLPPSEGKSRCSPSGKGRYVRGGEESHGRPAEVIFLPAGEDMRGRIGRRTQTGANIAVPRPFEVSTRHLAVAYNGVPRCPCGSPTSFSSSALSRDNYKLPLGRACILVGPRDRGPCAGPRALMGGVARRHNRRRARESGISTAHDISPSSR